LPYEISFRKRLDVSDPEIYFNDCCWGGDIIVERLLPAISSSYEHVQSDQEDWGWFIWFRRGAVLLGIDVFTEIPEEGSFLIHITARRKRWLIFDSIVDGPELEDIKALVLKNLESWTDSPAKVTHLDAHYMPSTGDT
jgi:hypothetical protein